MTIMNTNLKGLTTELKCQLYFLELGYEVSVPISPASRYDLILDVNNHLYRIQIKSSTATTSGFEFNCKSTHAKATGTNVIKPYTKDEIDYYMTIFDNQYYLISVNNCGTSHKRLSFNKEAKNQNGASTYHGNYIASEVLKAL